MTDEGLESLAKSLQHSKSLQQLNLCNGHTKINDNNIVLDWITSYPNTITKKGVSVLTECLKNKKSLSELILPADFESSTTTVQEAVNEARKRNGLPFIK